MAQNEYNNSLLSLQRGLDSAQKINSLELIRNAYSAFKDLYIAKKDFKNALTYSTLYTRLKDSILDLEKTNKIAELQAKYQNEKKENQILNQHKDILFKNRLLFALALILVIISVSLFFILFFYSKTNSAYKYLVKKNLELAEEKTKTDKSLLTEINNSNITSIDMEKIDQLSDLFINKLETEKVYLRKDITIESLAKELQSNRDYLSKAIHCKYGSFNDIINKYRIKEAVRLISENGSSLPIKAIYSKVGFSSYNPFHIAFKRHTGLTPGKFIKNYKHFKNDLFIL